MPNPPSTRNVSNLAEQAVELPARLGFSLVGHRLLLALQDLHGLIALSLITLGVLFTRFNHAAGIIHPRIRRQITDAGMRLLPMTSLLGVTLGLVIIGQTVSILNRIGAQEFTGTIMVTVVIRELGPLAAAFLTLARVGTATVIELGIARANGEVEALEALRIDPVHYLVLPKVLGLAAAIFSLTIYLIAVALLSGYTFSFLQNIPLKPGDYFGQLAAALQWEDFLVMALKTCSFGALIALTACYEGLARPISINEVSNATSRAVIRATTGCIAIDALFIILQWTL